MKRRTDLEFDVRWLPFQLNPNASDRPSSRMEAYMTKFGKSKEEVKQMSAWMGQKFQDAGLPFTFTETSLLSNTFEAHRVLTAAYEKGGAEAQDKAAEILFNAYFADGRAPNDANALRDAAQAAGLDSATFLADKSIAAGQVREELEVGRRMGVSGVPHFAITAGDAGRPIQISGAQPPEHFLAAFDRIARGSGQG